MIRLLTRSPMLMTIYPFYKSDNQYDKPAKMATKPLDDELGWDRVKKIFTLNENGLYTKELQSIIHITLAGTGAGLALGGMGATKSTVDNFIMNNEATKFASHFDARRSIQHSVAVNFVKKGGRLGMQIGIFCLIFSSISVCTTAYRGRLAIENYVFGGSITGLLFKMNLGFRGMLVGTGLGGILGGICGSMTVIILKLSGITIDEVLEAQKQWVDVRATLREKIKENMEAELPEVKKLYEENKKLQNLQERKDDENQNKI